MPSTINRALKRRFAVPYGCYKLISSRRSFLKESGWFESIRMSAPKSAGGDPVPWMNYSVVELIAERLGNEFDVFEYGSGYSTCFFASHSRSVVSVEYDQAWHDQVCSMIPENAQLIMQPYDGSDLYASTILGLKQKFDVIVVDGEDRVRCMENALGCLSDVGVLILDDSSRPEYQAGFDLMSVNGFRALTIGGLKPGSACRHQTTLFYRDQNCFDL